LEEVELKLYYNKERLTITMCVEKLSENTFRMTENDIFDYRLTKGTEFTTRLNDEGKHELVNITKKSDFITKRFFLPTKYKESDYRMLGEELTKGGGFWQVDFGGIATVNIPKDFEFDIDQVIEELGLKLTKITDS